MKTKILLLILLGTWLNGANSQWIYNNPYPTSNTICAIKFFNENTGWVAGYAGTILKTTNGGINWETQKTNLFNNLRSLYFIDLNTGYACGEKNCLLKTTDGGSSWVSLLESSLRTLMTVIFLDSNNGFIGGSNGIFRTNNGGFNWDTVKSGSVIINIKFINNSTGWAVGYNGEVHKTTNGGYNWFQQLTPTADILFSSTFINENTGWISANDLPMTSTPTNRILHTTDGGTNWFLQNTQTKTAIFDIAFINSNTGYSCGTFNNSYTSFPIFQKTTDSGNTWVSIQIFSDNQRLYALNKINNIIWTAGENIFKSSDDGTNWERITKGFYKDIYTLTIFPSLNTIYAAGESGFFARTTNNGANWTENTVSNSLFLSSMQFFNLNTGYVTDIGGIFKTTNGGINWILNSINEQFEKLFFIDENTGWATCFGPNSIYKTTNGGLNWNYQLLSAAYGFGLYFQNANTGFVGDVYGSIYKTTDGGTNWNGFNTGTGLWVADFEFINNNTGYAAGELNAVWKTTNTGTNWDLINIGTFGSFYDIEFLRDGANTPTVGYGVGTYGMIYRTSNSGESWYQMVSPTANNLVQVKFIDKYTGYLVGFNGTVLYTTNGGSTFIYNSSKYIPENYSLHQNYPNPFNSSTIISFDVKKNAHVKIVLYDMTGKEMDILVNEYFQAGSYKTTNWFGNYPSGVYFYKMTSDGFSETKKLILIK